jgi:DNA gyrase subunit A
VIAAIRGAGSPQQALALLQGLEPLPEGVREFWSRTTRRWPSNGRNPFDFTEVQARAILDMQLRRLTGLERQELLDEHAVVMERIAYLEDLLANPRKIDFLIKDDILELKNKYGDVRRTEIVEADPEDFAEEDLVPHQESVITLSMRNYVKRTPLEDYRTQRRGGQGSRGAQIREEDAVVRLVVCDSHDSLLVFTDQGRVYQMRAFDIPDAKKQAKGTFITNLIELEPGERVTTIVAAREFSSDFMVLATRAGAVKKTPLSEFEEVRRNGKIAMRLDDGDELVSAQIATKESWVLLVTSNGQAIRFHCDDLREASRASGGVRGIRMASGVYLVGASVVRSEDEQLLVVTEKGFGKRTAAGQYPVQGRGGQGVRTLNITPKTGNVATCRVVSPDEQLMLISRDGIVMRTQVDTISLLGRATQGVTIMRMGTEDIVSAVAVVALTPEAEGKRKAAAAGGNGGRAAPRRTNGHNPSAT